MMQYKIKRKPPEELKHWGIKGQRWGFRRFENYDGSLTPEGKKRYNGGYHHEDNVRKDFDNYLKRNSGEINRLVGDVAGSKIRI